MNSIIRNTKINAIIDNLTADYALGMTMKQLAEKYSCGLSSISMAFKRLGVKARPKSYGANYHLPLTKEEIKQKYIEGVPTTELARQCHTSSSVINSHLANMGVARRSHTHAHRKYSIDEHFFGTIDTPEKAYWLGFFYADGYNNEKKRTVALRLSTKDLCLVEAFKIAVKTEAPIEQYTDKRGFNFCRLDLYNKQLSEDLTRQGCMQAKTFLITFPEIKQEIQADFMRGYFDGDGCVSMSATASCMEVAGTEKFLKRYQQILMTNCALSETQLAKRGKIHILRYGGRLQLRRIFTFLYPDSCMKLLRKWDRFKEVMA